MSKREHEKKREPNLRFSGFTDDWEQRKLGDMGTTFTGLSGKTKDDFGHGDARFVTYMNVFTNPISDPDRIEAVEIDDSQNSVQYGDVFFTTSSETPEEVGMSSVWLENADNIYLNSFCFGYRPIKEIDSHYMAYMLRTEAVRKKTIYLAQGISRYNISKNGVMQIEVPLPDIAEQKLIGEFLFKIDNLITLHQRRLEKIEILKRAMLQKMFPKDGEKNPEIRFPGFTADWEQRKFGDDIISIQTGTNLLGSTTNKGTPLLKMGNIQRGYFDISKMEYLDENEEVEEENIAYYGDFFFNTRNTLELVGKGATWFGEDGKYAFNSNIARFKFKDLNTVFFNYLYNTDNMIKQIHARATGTTSVAAIYPRSLETVTYFVPSDEEQKRIGGFFEMLDEAITLHQRELEELNKLKKTMLAMMFI